MICSNSNLVSSAAIVAIYALTISLLISPLHLLLLLLLLLINQWNNDWRSYPTPLDTSGLAFSLFILNGLKDCLSISISFVFIWGLFLAKNSIETNVTFLILTIVWR